MGRILSWGFRTQLSFWEGRISYHPSFHLARPCRLCSLDAASKSPALQSPGRVMKTLIFEPHPKSSEYEALSGEYCSLYSK